MELMRQYKGFKFCASQAS